MCCCCSSGISTHTHAHTFVYTGKRDDVLLAGARNGFDDILYSKRYNSRRGVWRIRFSENSDETYKVFNFYPGKKNQPSPPAGQKRNYATISKTTPLYRRPRALVFITLFDYVLLPPPCARPDVVWWWLPSLARDDPAKKTTTTLSPNACVCVFKCECAYIGNIIIVKILLRTHLTPLFTHKRRAVVLVCMRVCSMCATRSSS